MSARLKLADAIENGGEVTVNGLHLQKDEVRMIVDSMRAVCARPEATSASVAEHAGRLIACHKWAQFARFYGSDERAWEAMRAVAASALAQKEGG